MRIPIYSVAFGLLFFSVLDSIYAQPKSVSYGMRGDYGYLIKHRREIDAALENRFPRGAEVFVHIQTNGDKPWQHEWNYPEIGFSLGWYDLDNPVVLGDVFVGSAYIQKYLRPRQLKQNLSFKIAPGISYNTREYDPETNPINILNSLPINFVMAGNFLYHYRFNPHWELHGGISFTHYSNGAVRKPNKGVNIPALTIGMAYTPRPALFQVNHDVQFDYAKASSLDLMVSGGFKSAGEAHPKVDQALNLSLFGNRRVSSKSGISIGTELIYNGTIPKVLNKDSANPYRVGVVFGHELYISKITFLTQIGYYIYRPEKKLDQPIYLRWGIKHYFSPSIFTSLLLKAHYGKADLIEFGIGYRISKQK